MVGDSVNDFLAGSCAGTATVMVDWGYSQGTDVLSLGADRVISDFSELG